MSLTELRLFKIKGVYGKEYIYAPGHEEAKHIYKVLCPVAMKHGVSIEEQVGLADTNHYFVGTREEWIKSVCKDEDVRSFGLNPGTPIIKPEETYSKKEAESYAR